jgi:hypothetical protein
MKMASNVDKVEEKARDDLENALKRSKDQEEAERKLSSGNVSYKIKDETKEGTKQPYIQDK